MRPASLSATLLALCALTLAACGDTIQDQPAARDALEPLIASPAFPVYWLGGVFHGLAITEASHDPGGAYTLQYGDCTVGGQYSCVTPLSIVTSPDNSFLPGDAPDRPTVSVRGARGVLAQHGETIAIATGAVVVSIYANSPALALAAARTMTPINRPDLPGARLPAALPDSGFGVQPLPAQEPTGGPLPSALRAGT
jgi:hypothetical protein